MLRSDFCDYSEVYIVLKGIISVTCTNGANRGNNKLIFKNNSQFRSCIRKLNNTLVDNAEDFDIIMPMYNLLDYSENYYITQESLWIYYRNVMKMKLMIMVIR